MEYFQPSWRGRSISSRQDSNGRKYTAMMGSKSLLYIPVSVMPNAVYKVTLEVCRESGNGILYCNLYGNRNFDFHHSKIVCGSSNWTTFDVDVMTKDFPKTIPIVFRIWRGKEGTGTLLIRRIIVNLEKESSSVKGSKVVAVGEPGPIPPNPINLKKEDETPKRVSPKQKKVKRSGKPITKPKSSKSKKPPREEVVKLLTVAGPTLEAGRKLASVLIPSRGRFDELLKAIDSVINNANDLSRVEILLRFDEDDESSMSRLGELPSDKVDMNIAVGKRHGYMDLHEYVNSMCREAKGEFILWFNDDCIIQTKNWDGIISKFIGKMVCLYPNNNGTGSGNIFPIINRRIYEVLGHFSLSQQVDSWQHMVNLEAGVEISVPELVFIHNRRQQYISDSNREEVLMKTKEIWLSMRNHRREDARKIRRYVENNRKSL